METRGLQAFHRIENQPPAGRAAQRQNEEDSLTPAEQTMIRKKFTRNNTPLEIYEGSGTVRKEHPAARGTRIDITV